ncbi:MAG TPA: alanine racemase [Pyrinomonadaceae bacterium]
MNQWNDGSMNQSSGRPTWAEIDLDALAHNFRAIRERVGPGVRILAAVKANAYGHGAVECSKRLEREGVDWFGVALPEEGIELRTAGISKPILCLGGIWAGQETVCIQQDLTPVVYRLDVVEALDHAAKAAGRPVDVHVKIDTGMGRLGVRSDDVPDFCAALKRFANIRVEGLMTHLASADDVEQTDFTTLQLQRFEQAVAAFRDHGFEPTYIHAANSAGLFAFAESRANLVRPGGALYGFTRDVLPPNLDPPRLRPVLSLYSRIMLLKRVPKGEKLGYGGTFETRRDSVIATVPIGYDDGYRRALSNRARVIVRGQFAPVAGRVSMDLTIIDVTEVADVTPDDRVTLLGSNGDCAITAEDLGELAGTISYEITCGISSRVPRVFRG